MKKNLWTRVGLAAAAIFGVAAATGVTTANTDTVAGALGALSDNAQSASDRIAASFAEVNFRYQFVPEGTEYFGQADLVEDTADTNGFSWG
jgi:hypothetical protein